MLKSLTIKNYALIEHLELIPSEQLTIITGETGAGKSIMLGAIGLLLGNRADIKALYNKEEKCVIEAAFDIEGYGLEFLFEQADIDFDNHCVIRREINPAGKSRVFINDTPANLETLKSIGNSLMDIHSQHETLLLGNADFQLSIIDAFAKNSALRNKFNKLFKEYKMLKAESDNLIAESEEARRQEDYHKFLLKELADTELQEEEQEKSEGELKLLENSEEIKARLNTIVQKISSSEEAVLSQLQFVEKNAAFLSQFSDTYKNLHERLKSCLYEIKDISYEYESEEEGVESGHERIEFLKSRLSEIYSLQKKHNVATVKDLLNIQKDLESKVQLADDMEDRMKELKRQLDQSYSALQAAAAELSDTRNAVLDTVKTALEDLLHEVGMPNAVIDIRHQKGGITSGGVDQITILFSANKGIAPQDLKSVGSGGEFSRLMLCIKYMLADKKYMPTIIFDEIDTGISGEIAIKVGKMMKEMSKNHQVISISHLPQIAAQGIAHFYVYKDHTKERTTSKIKKLSKEERIFEIAQMIGGAKPSEIAITNAKELLSLVD